MHSPLALSPSVRLSHAAFGLECQPLLLADDALADIALVRAIAAQHQFRPIGPHYPGIRAAVSADVAMPLVTPLLTAMRQLFALERDPQFHECFLSLTTLASAQLAPIQRLPHFDGVERERIAVLLYLDPAERGGTSFFRQLATGFESVDATRLETYRQALASGVAEHGLPPPRYIGTGAPLFTRSHQVEGRLNRLIAYRGHTLHCADLADGFVPDTSPATGRLTLNLFLH